ncbi:MAG: 3-phosphoshikimate 1-carboxyvinyltransferase [Methanobacteriaceae archaeon]|nr:3-phosphoshikimate 1-carboxyvinyltransferase [Methanobacteriaceae archaeon]
MELTVKKTDEIYGVIKAPPSKSYTHRAVIIASLAEGTSILRDPLYSEDTNASIAACRCFGTDIETFDKYCKVEGTSGKLKTPEDVINVKNSGTTLRIMTSVSALSPGTTVLTGDDSLRKRPMQDLLDALKKLKVNAYSTRNNGMPPIVINSGLSGGETCIKGNISSQFISSLLISSTYAKKPVHIKVKGDFISKPYVDMTIDVMEKFGVKVEFEWEKNMFHVDPGVYKSTDYTIEGDYSSASYLVAAAAALRSEVTIKNLFKKSKQGDKIILDIVQEMGAQVKIRDDEIKIISNGNLIGIDVDLSNSPDLLPTIAALGAVAQGKTRIFGAEHARFKETDRIHTSAVELSKLGVKVSEKDDGLIIEGGAKGGVVNSHMDHRLVMALSIVGIKVGNIKIKNASCYEVSFPHFPQVMNKLGCRLVI